VLVTVACSVAESNCSGHSCRKPALHSSIADTGIVARRRTYSCSIRSVAVAVAAAAEAVVAEIAAIAAVAEALEAHSAALDGFGSSGNSAGAAVGLEQACCPALSLSSCSACLAWVCLLSQPGSSSVRMRLRVLCCYVLEVHDWMRPAGRARSVVVGSLVAAAHCSLVLKQFGLAEHMTPMVVLNRSSTCCCLLSDFL
jgi:hypothetical protein